MPAPRSLSLSRRLAVGALSGAALIMLTGWTPAPATPAAPWSSRVTVSPIGAYVVGNPDAKVRLVEYLSYTCSHCGDFAKASATSLKTKYVDTGLVAVEYRNLVRDPVDMTAALLARCGTTRAFEGNHQAIFAAQSAWIGRISKATEAQKASWFEGTTGQSAGRIATDVGLRALMQRRGYNAAQIDACLDSGVAQAQLLGMTNIALGADKVQGTPSFSINGRNTGVHDWPSLKTRLDLAIKGS